MTTFPDKLSTVPSSPHFNETICRKVGKVFVDGVHVPNCVAYDKVNGWAFSKVNGIWQPKLFGVVTVEAKVFE